MLLDLHSYSQLSGGAPLDALVDRARKDGLDGICVADRERSAETAIAVASGRYDFPVFVGVELVTRSGDAIVITPELDPFMTREEWRQVNSLERPELSEVVELARDNGGVVLLAQPYDRERKGSPRDRIFVLSGINGVEIGTDGTDGVSNRVALEAVGRSSVPAFAGSARRGAAQSSSWLTLFSTPVSTQEELVAGILGGNFWAVEVGGGGLGSRRQGRR